MSTTNHRRKPGGRGGAAGRTVARRIVYPLVAALAYAPAFLLLYPQFGQPVRALTFIPVVGAAWAWGVWGGIVAAAIGVVENQLLNYVVGPSPTGSLASPGHGAWFGLVTILFVGGLSGRMRDLERRVRSQLNQLQDAEASYRFVFENNPQPMLVVDPRTLLISDVNEAAARHCGASKQQLVGSSIEAFFPTGEVRELVLTSGPSVRTTKREGTRRHRRHDGTNLDLEISSHMVWFRGQESRLVLINDVTERKRAEEALAYRASHDSLTDLPNRALLLDRLERGLGAASPGGRPLALLLIDLDRFKEINDTYGHHYGDLVLKEVSPRLRAALRQSDTVARLGGDEFAIFLPETDRVGAVSVAEKVLANLKRPIIVEGKRLEVGASIGIALHPEQGVDSKTLMHRADVAMYAAKRNRCGHAVYSADQEPDSPLQVTILTELRQAFDGEQFVLHYQPKADLKTGRVEGAEALIRWQHPQQGLLAPAQFLPQVEQAGLLKAMSLWVINHALQQARKWHELGLPIHVSVNLAARSLQDMQLVESIEQLLESAGCPPSWLVIEVAEKDLIADPSAVKAALQELRSLGVGLAIDQFGTRHTSLAIMKDLAVDEIKIDRSFIKPVTADQESAIMVRSIVELGHSEGLRLVAEGIENRTTWERLALLGCDLAQGFYLSHPLTPERFLEWAQETRSPQTLPRVQERKLVG